MTAARSQILAKLKAARVSQRVDATPYHPKIPDDLAAEFTRRAEAADGIVHEIASEFELAQKLQSLFSANSGATPIHIAKGSSLHALGWERAHQLSLLDTAPPGEALALSEADFAIAETGTLAFFSGTTRPSSWHFLPGIECVLLRRAAILPAMEDVFARLADATMPSTVNLVTGPSRTADIEQTIERGAHGPRELHIFLTAA